MNWKRLIIYLNEKLKLKFIAFIDIDSVKICQIEFSNNFIE